MSSRTFTILFSETNEQPNNHQRSVELCDQSIAAAFSGKFTSDDLDFPRRVDHAHGQPLEYGLQFP